MKKEIGLTKKLVQIYNPVNENYIGFLDKRTIQNPYKNKLTFLSIGRFEPQKGFDMLLDAFSMIANKYTRIHLVILGDGPLREELENKINVLHLEDRVHLPGFESNILPYLYYAQALVSSSVYEGLPNVLIESITVGTPVIATNCPGGTAEIVVPGKNGVMCHKISANALADVWGCFIDSDTHYQRKCVKKTANKFHPNLIYKKYDELFNLAIH